MTRSHFSCSASSSLPRPLTFSNRSIRLEKMPASSMPGSFRKGGGNITRRLTNATGGRAAPAGAGPRPAASVSRSRDKGAQSSSRLSICAPPGLAQRKLATRLTSRPTHSRKRRGTTGIGSPFRGSTRSVRRRDFVRSSSRVLSRAAVRPLHDPAALQGHDQESCLCKPPIVMARK